MENAIRDLERFVNKYRNSDEIACCHAAAVCALLVGCLKAGLAKQLRDVVTRFVENMAKELMGR